MNTMAIMLPNWVGDACMATPALRALHRMFGQSHNILWIGRPAPLMVLEGLPWVHRTWMYKPKARGDGLNRRRLIRRMREERIGCMVLLTNSLSTAAMAWLGGAKRRVGFARDARSLLLTDRLPVQQGSADATKDPCIDNYLRIVKSLGCDTSDRRMELVATSNDRQLADALWSRLGWDLRTPTLVLNAGAATAQTKRWALDHAATFAREIASQHRYQVLVHCGPAEVEMARAIEGQANHPLVRSMGHAPSLPLGLSKSVIERAHVVVSTDSGPRHIAVAMNKPVVSLFGPIGPEATRTYNEPEFTIRLGLDCQPCGKYDCPLGHARCMTDLDSRRVLKATETILASQPATNRLAS